MSARCNGVGKYILLIGSLTDHLEDTKITFLDIFVGLLEFLPLLVQFKLGQGFLMTGSSVFTRGRDQRERTKLKTFNRALTCKRKARWVFSSFGSKARRIIISIRRSYCRCANFSSFLHFFAHAFFTGGPSLGTGWELELPPASGKKLPEPRPQEYIHLPVCGFLPFAVPAERIFWPAQASFINFWWHRSMRRSHRSRRSSKSSLGSSTVNSEMSGDLRT